MKSVIKGAGYILCHVPDMVLHNGTTQTTEMIVNPDGDYLKELPSHIRSWEDVLQYWPNQVYIGNKTPDELAAIPQPFYQTPCDVTERYGHFGQMMPQEEFLFLMQASDVFDLVYLDKNFVAQYKEQFAANKMIDESIVARVKDGIELSEIERLVRDEHSEGLYNHGTLVGCVKRAHDIDVNLSAHVMHENIVSKASSVLALLSGVENAGIAKAAASTSACAGPAQNPRLSEPEAETRPAISAAALAKLQPPRWFISPQDSSQQSMTYSTSAFAMPAFSTPESRARPEDALETIFSCIT